MTEFERFDGYVVPVYGGKFTGVFDMDEDAARDLSIDDVVTFVVEAKLSAAGFSETKTGDMKRTNTFRVNGATALDPRTATKVLAVLDGPNVTVPSPATLGLNDDLTVQRAEAQARVTATQEDLEFNTPVLREEDELPKIIPVQDPVLLRFLDEG